MCPPGTCFNASEFTHPPKLRSKRHHPGCSLEWLSPGEQQLRSSEEEVWRDATPTRGSHSPG